MFDIGDTQRSTRENWEHDSEVTEMDDDMETSSVFIVRSRKELLEAIERTTEHKIIYCSSDTLCSLGELAANRMCPEKALQFKKSLD